MKKFFSFLCALAIVLSASAAPLKVAKVEKAVKAPLALKKMPDLKALEASGLKKPAKAPKAAQAESIAIAVSDITFNSAHAVFTPSDAEAYYVFDYAPASYMQGKTDAQLANDLISSYKEYIAEEYGSAYVSYLLPYLFCSDEYEYDIEGLAANTEYVAYAFYVDESGNLQGSVFKKSFKTQEVNASKKEDLSILDGTVYVYDFGAWQFWGQNANAVISVTAYSDEIAGSYSGSDMAFDYCYIGKVAGSDTTWYIAVDANLQVAVLGNSALINGTLTAQNEDDEEDIIEFTLTLSGALEDVVSGLDYDEETEDFNENFTSYTIDDTYYSQYGDLTIEASNDNNASLVLDIFPANGSKELTAGTYSIEDSGDPKTVYPGEPYNGYLYPSFVGYQGSQGYTQIWFLVEGTVTVSANGDIDVDALNSYGRSIKCHLSKGGETAIENTKAAVNATKRLVNGQLLIEKNGARYNAIGTLVK